MCRHSSTCNSKMGMVASFSSSSNNFCLYKRRDSLIQSHSTNRIGLGLSSSFLLLSFHVSILSSPVIRGVPNIPSTHIKKKNLSFCFQPSYMAIPFQLTLLNYPTFLQRMNSVIYNFIIRSQEKNSNLGPPDF